MTDLLYSLYKAQQERISLLAVVEAQTAQMWAVRASTWNL